jgi:hypothetical protein
MASPEVEDRKLCQLAARDYLAGKYANPRQAGVAHGVSEFRKVHYWLKRFDDHGLTEQIKIAGAVVLQQQKPVHAQCQSEQQEARPLKFGEEGHWERYSAAFKDAGHMHRKGASRREVASTVSAKHGVSFSASTAGRAAHSVDEKQAKRSKQGEEILKEKGQAFGNMTGDELVCVAAFLGVTFPPECSKVGDRKAHLQSHCSGISLVQGLVVINNGN